LSTDVEHELHSTSQAGPIASGRKLGDILSKEISSSELRFLQDHAYTLFESRLSELALVEEFAVSTSLKVTDKSFAKVTAKLQINDLARSAKVLKDFNKIGEAQWRVVNEQMSMAASSKNPFGWRR
jgi:hypothetical protein